VIVKLYKYNLRKALQAAFPHLHFIGKLPKREPERETLIKLNCIEKERNKEDNNEMLGMWIDSNRLRQFFDGYAASKGLDPTNPDSWYSINTKEILKEPVPSPRPSLPFSSTSLCHSPSLTLSHRTDAQSSR